MVKPKEAHDSKYLRQPFILEARMLKELRRRLDEATQKDDAVGQQKALAAMQRILAAMRKGAILFRTCPTIGDTIKPMKPEHWHNRIGPRAFAHICVAAVLLALFLTYASRWLWPGLHP